ncbi:uncharacterized protein ACBT57_013567 isoform 10-T10 [Dama dama]
MRWSLDIAVCILRIQFSETTLEVFESFVLLSDIMTNFEKNCFFLFFIDKCEGEQERPAETVGDLRKKFEPQKTNRPQRKSDDHGKVFEVHDRNGNISRLPHSGVDQNRNVPNQESQERNEPQERNEKTQVKSEDPQEKNEQRQTSYDQCEGEQEGHTRTVGDLQKNFGLQGKNGVQEQNAPQERSEKTPVKSVKGEQDIDKLQIKIDDIQKKIGDLLKKFDKGENDKYDLLRKLHKTEQDRDKIKQEKDKIAQEKEELQNKSEQLKKEIEKKKAQFKSVWQETPLYADWRKEEFQTVNLTLDAATAHPALFLSEDGRRVTWQEPCQELPSCSQRFVSLPCVLGQLHVCSGRFFWEVEVGDAHSWDLGVCRDNVVRNGRVTMSPQNGFWAIRLYDGEYWGLTSPETSLTLKEKPCRVGVFLDYKDGDVSFYNMVDGSHIFTFSKQTFYGVLRPLFRLQSSDSGSLTIVQVE